MADLEDEEQSELTFGTLHTPSLEHQHAAQKKPPKMTPLPKRVSKLRRIPGADTDINYTFKNSFGKTEFRGQQETIMKAALQGLDILVIAPTGLGKSLCFQVPAIADNHGVTIVICPLISLMNDQVNALRHLRLPAAMLTSTTSEEGAKKIYKDLKCGHPKTRLLYVTPERIGTESFQKKLAIVYKQNELARFVVDESHCIEEWGNTFRKSYNQLGKLRQLFPKVPIMALTASATEYVADTIIDTLLMDRDYFLKITHPFNRANLFYEVRYVKQGAADDRLDDIADFIRKQYRRHAEKAGSDQDALPVSGIVYARAKATCDGIADFLKRKGIRAATYHRGMKPEVAQMTQDRWLDNDKLRAANKAHVDCIVATVAFGMGIDKPNCRYVVHYDLPKSFEGYYQETGRAGRDGHSARALLYYSPEDEHRVVFFAKDAARKMKKAATENGEQAPVSKHAADSVSKLVAFVKDTKTCRHVGICRYFGEEVDMDDAPRLCERFCDVCRDPVKVSQNLEATATQFSPAATQRFQKEGFREEADDSLGSNELSVDPFENLTSPARPPPAAPAKRRLAPQAEPPRKKARTAELAPICDADMGLDELTNIPAVSIAAGNKLRKTFAYKTPFRKEMDPTELKRLKGNNQKSTSSHPSPPRQIVLMPHPSLTSKNIPQLVRDEAIVSMDKHLCRALLSKYGVRTQAEEKAIFSAFDGSALSTAQRRAVLLRAASELESDTLWTVLTLSGYKDCIERRLEMISADELDPDVSEALKRAVRVVMHTEEED